MFRTEVDASGRRFFVRLGQDLPFYGVSRLREQSAARAAHACGVGPAVRHGERDVMVVDFVEGSRALTEEDLRSPELLSKVTEVLRRLHAAPVPLELEAFQREEKGGWGGPHLEKWLRYAEEQRYARLPLLSGLREFIASLEAVAGPVGPNKFCHFDLLADNLVLSLGLDCLKYPKMRPIRKDGSIQLVDFEYAAPGQPLMDLAVLAMGCSLNDEEAARLLSAYLQRVAGVEELRSFQAIKTRKRTHNT